MPAMMVGRQMIRIVRSPSNSKRYLGRSQRTAGHPRYFDLDPVEGHTTGEIFEPLPIQSKVQQCPQQHVSAGASGRIDYGYFIFFWHNLINIATMFHKATRLPC